MNVNPLILELNMVTGYPVVPDLYEGNEDKWIVFTYADERGELYGDDVELYTTAKLYVSFYCPMSWNYMADKKVIKKKLVELGFQVESISSYIDDSLEGAEKVRRVLFEVNITAQND